MLLGLIPAPVSGLAPVNTASPVITGTSAKVGLALVASTGTWTNSPTSFAYQWKAAGVDIVDAIGAVYGPTVADVGKVITVAVTASNASGPSTPKVSAATAAVTSTSPSSGSSIVISPGTEFAADSIVHTPLPNNQPLDPASATMVANLVSQVDVYGGFCSMNLGAYTPSIFIVGGSVPTQAVIMSNDRGDPGARPLLEEQLAAVPIPPDFAASPGGDGEAVIYQPSTGKYWEFWIMGKTGDTTVNSLGQVVEQWGCMWGGQMGPGRSSTTIAVNRGWWVTEPNGYSFGTTAAALPFLAYTVTVADWRAGVIEHPIGIALVDAADTVFYPPAQRSDGYQVGEGGQCPEGAWLRFPAALNLDAISMTPLALMLAKAVRKYGMVVWDRAGNVSWRGENPAFGLGLDRWTASGGDPYSKIGGIFGVQSGDDIDDPKFYPTTEAGALFEGFPFDQLQVIELGSWT